MRRCGETLYARQQSIVLRHFCTGFKTFVRCKFDHVGNQFYLLKSKFSPHTRTHTQTQLYGLEAHEIRNEKLGKIILCTSSVSTGSEYEFTKQQRIDLELLFIVLSYIQMKGDTVAEATLFSFLKRMDVSDEPHERYGYFKKKIAETFTRQLYLKREIIKIEGGNAEDR